ncbi:pyrroline-5-carboxylate reductase [Tumebacillus flagellatus]|uniref:Pyrroline-5-carboxylate reductase n=1 Tax=Tumebacillus flagellatus TaxID=1157490 RepID=A0A074LUN2_9BACL|nr:pyrroline-5-carboxylate reductase [Tumebacillus flagellatus]KEO84624.1 pyrroline-5-carboxylate reductase [Tumebacillus flagellatus]
MRKQRILFIGAGRMAEAIFAGVLRTQKDYIEEIIVSNRSDLARLQAMREAHGVTVTQDWRESAPQADVIVLAMPPQHHRAVLTELAPYVNGQLVLTVAAGIGVGLLEELLPAGTPVVWIMPNTAAGIGESITLFTCGRHVEDKQRDALQMILAGIGESVECTEQQVHDLTAISGSAPAFFYRMAEELEVSAMSYGLPQDAARKLVAQMIYGSAAMLKTGADPAQLRDSVTTPGGATAAGLRVMEERKFSEMMQDAVLATNARAREMANE